ncbi:MAG: hypothetical protein UW23_C0035G0006 [Candidatus Collierbacteria bacterium GW2011_GWA1_44_12]|uniref:Type 4 fimbrial biogenesis protein PilX N-terminal domain-containing protein n=1 Tax=Candidatus Collierbacteria bacterium GW2011_GWA1_44_12 TaxID=1618376 RepID=A0A0G1GHW2_9BACT|nr:MAG: hypothetical protein UW23_C0035G0006 [Candidatus Collierbacteria bacterium GW2011_GWA1_44_12]
MVIRNSSGQASLVLVLLVGLVAMIVTLSSGTLSVSNVQIEETIHTADSAWYAAWAGVDELMYRLRSGQRFGDTYSVTLTLDNGATVSAQIIGDNTQRTVQSEGFIDGVTKRLEVKVASSSSKASFIFAAQSGEGGFELEGGTLVVGANNTSGNVYSNGSVLGVRASSGIAGSRILGSVWAVGTIGGLASPDTGGVYIQKDARAGSLTACLVNGNVRSPAPPTNCPYAGNYLSTNPPSPVEMASVDANYWKNKALAGGVWSGDCTVLETDGTDCTLGTGILGNRQILGNLSVPSGINLTIDGPIWVKGDIDIAQNNTLSTAESAEKDSIVVVASDPDNPLVKGRIVTSSNVQYALNSQGAGLIFISENRGDICEINPAIELTSNTATVVFVAVDGCINIGSNSVISGVLGKKVHLKSNSIVSYDPSLAQAILGTDTGGWSVVSITEY